MPVANTVTVRPISPASLTNDPPPPYPSRGRRTRTSRSGRRRAPPPQPSTDSDHDTASSHLLLTSDDGDAAVNANASETSPLIAPSSPRSATRHPAGRPRSASHTSTLFSSASAAPSLAQTVLSLFHGDSDLDYESEGEEQPLLSVEGPALGRRHCHPERRRPEFFSRRGLRVYFRPLGQWAYYGPLFHLMVLNFPYALAAWVYLFVFTLTGTALLMALPLGAILCFFDLLGARAFARGELALQTRFHCPLAYPPPYPPRPIFTRLRSPGTTPPLAVESGAAQSQVYETSFYKNTYAMFTDSTSYQALFYFLVIKPSITLTLTAMLFVAVPVTFALVVPAPAMLRAVRRFGIWQAGVAVEGLYFAVS